MLVADLTGAALSKFIMHDLVVTVIYDLLSIPLHNVRKELLLFVFTSSTHSDRCVLFCISHENWPPIVQLLVLSGIASNTVWHFYLLSLQSFIISGYYASYFYFKPINYFSSGQK